MHVITFNAGAETTRTTYLDTETRAGKRNLLHVLSELVRTNAYFCRVCPVGCQSSKCLAGRGDTYNNVSLKQCVECILTPRQDRPTVATTFAQLVSDVHNVDLAVDNDKTQLAADEAKDAAGHDRIVAAVAKAPRLVTKPDKSLEVWTLLPDGKTVSMSPVVSADDPIDDAPTPPAPANPAAPTA